MGNNFIPTFWGTKDMDKFLIGFDEQFNRLQKFHDDMSKNIPNYPPYNIVKKDENHYTIELAVAGFGQSDIDIEMEDGTIVSDPAFIKEFYLNCDSAVVHGLQDKLDTLAKSAGLAPIENTCEECKKSYSLPLEFDYANFFAIGS
jgi:hypothetical protein